MLRQSSPLEGIHHLLAGGFLFGILSKIRNARSVDNLEELPVCSQPRTVPICPPLLRLILWTFLLLGTLFPCTSLFAQNPFGQPLSVEIRRISREQGLSSQLVRSIIQDRFGFIWISCDPGLDRYDGESFVHFGSGNDSTALTHFSVWTLCADNDGAVWAGTLRGINRYDPPTRTFQRYLHNPKDTKSISDNEIRSLLVDRHGTLWVGTMNGLNRFERETRSWIRYYPVHGDSTRPGANAVNSIVEDRNGLLWIGTGGDEQRRGGGVFSFDRPSGRFLAVGPRIKIYSLYEDRTGVIWVGSSGLGLFTVDRTRGTLVRVPLPPREAGNIDMQRINAICEDARGTLWVGTKGWTLLRYDRASRSFTQYISDPLNPGSISSSGINALFVDRDGLLWIGTDRGGLNTIASRPFRYLSTLGSLRLTSRTDLVFADRDGQLWIGSQGVGLWRFNPSNGRSTCILPTEAVRCVVQDDHGILWIVGRFTLHRYDPSSRILSPAWNVPEVRGARDRLVTLTIDRERNYWLGGNASLFRVSRDLKTYAVFHHDPTDPGTITGGQIAGITEDRLGNIWVGSAEGLSRFDRTSGRFTRFHHDEADPTSISDSNWCRVYVDRRGTLWVPTLNGLNRLNDTNATFTRFTHRDRRFPPNVSFLQEDRRGRFWFNGDNRIGCFSPDNNTFTMFDQSDGLQSTQILSWSHTRLTTGEIVFGTMDGVMLFHPDSLRILAHPPPIVITKIRKLHRDVRPRGPEDSFRQIVLSHEENVFSISYAALSYDMPEYNRYSYQLEGFDKSWVDCGNRREVMYTNLDPGEYTFRVRGSNHDFVWNEAGTSMAVVVRPAYWQTWWFKLALLLALFGLFLAVYRREVMRLRRVQRLQQEFSRQQIAFQESERKRLAADLHDGLGQDLLIVANEVRAVMKESTGQQKRMKEIAALVSGSVDSAREIASNLHPHQLDRLGFRAAVGSLSRSLSHSSRITVDHSCADVDGLLPKEAELHLYRVIQEALTNAARHAAAKRIFVCVKILDGQISAVIGDDGKGFNPKELPARGTRPRQGDGLRGFGLTSMAERARIIGGTLTIDASPGSGTTVTITIPF